MKSLGNVVNYTLLALWLVSVALLITIGVNQMMEYSTQGRVVTKQTLNMNPKDTLQIKFVHNDNFANDVNDQTDFEIKQDTTNQNVLYSNNVHFTIVKTDELLPYLQVTKQAKGRDLAVAKNKAEKIEYSFSFSNNQLILNNYLITDVKNKFRDQEVELTLYLPKGTLFKTDKSVEEYDESDDEFFNLQYDVENAVYIMEQSQVKCLNCPTYGIDGTTELNTTSSDTIREVILKINGKEIITSETSSKTTELTIDENGTIIKTK